VIAPGSILGGKNVVESVLGKGGMGVVVAATHVALGHRVAITTMRREASESPEVVARFEREAKAAARLQSEHAARVTDVGRFDEGTPYMVMEFLEGEDLAQRIERDGPLPVGDALSLFMQCCIGLHEAHAIGLVHRDVKPSNVFLARRASGRTVAKVLDFGIAKANEESRDHALTQTSAFLGSPLASARLSQRTDAGRALLRARKQGSACVAAPMGLALAASLRRGGSRLRALCRQVVPRGDRGRWQRPSSGSSATSDAGEGSP
jgi:serine/threonine-protein kinase